jgi:hypothetical protein
VAGEPVDEVVLAAVGLIGDYHEKGIRQGLRGQAGVKAGECLMQPALKDDVPAVGIGALSARFTDSKVRSVQDPGSPAL